MKIIVLFSLLMLFSINSLSQENTIINVGVGMPVFFRHNFRAPEYGPYTLKYNRIHLFIEKPVSLGAAKKISLNPGIAYFVFNESAESGGLGQHSYREVKHKAYSISTRLFYHFRINPEKSNRCYSGITAGKYIWSESTGASSWYRLEESHYIGGNKVIDDSGKAFFHSFYYGFTGGFTGLTKENSRFAPAFEISFYPDFFTLNDKKWPMGMFSVILKTKKKLPKTE